MVPTDDLFLLIKSLSKSEKRYFKLFASRHITSGDNNSIKLFDFIERQKKYDEAAVKIKFRKEKFIKQLWVTKNYLYNTILKSLTDFHRNQNTNHKILDYLQQIEILFEKTLYAQCYKLIKAAKKLAGEFGKHNLLAEIIRWEITLRIYTVSLPKGEHSLMELFDEAQKTNNNVLTINEYWRLNTKLNEIVSRKGMIRSVKEKEELIALAKHPLITDESNAQHFDAKAMLYHFLYRYYFNMGDLEKSYIYSSKLILLYESTGAKLKEYIIRILISFQNHALLLLRMPKYDELLALIDKLNSIYTDSSLHLGNNSRSFIYLTIHTYKIAFLINTGDAEKAIAPMKEMEHWLEKNEHSANPVLVKYMYYEFACAYIINDKYKLALSWINKLLHTSEQVARQDLYAFAKIINIIIHYELGNRVHLDYVVKSVYRFLYKREQLYELERIILQFIRTDISRINSKETEKEYFIKLHKKIQQLEKNTFEKKALLYFDLLSWLESKIYKRPMNEILKEKYQATQKRNHLRKQ